MGTNNLLSRIIVTALFCVSHFVQVQAQEHNSVVNAEDSVAMFVNMEDVVVTAQYAPTDSKNALQTIQVINREKIEQQGANNLEQLLQQNLNIRISQDLLMGSSLSLLGVGGENIKIMIDGVPMVGRLDGNLDLSQINLNNIERVEIVEGPMSVAYGTDALGGVINLITKKSQRFPFELSFNQQLETRAENSSAVDGGLRLGDKLLFRFNGGRDWFNGFSEDTTRSVLWNPKDQWYADLSLRYDFLDDHRLIYQFSHFDEEVQNLGDVRRPQFKPYAFDDYFLTQRTNHALTHEGTVLKNYYWQNTLGYNAFDREVNSYRLNFDEGDQNIIGGDTTTFDTYMLRSVFASNFRNKKVNFQLGIDLRYEQGRGARIIDEASDQLGQSDIGDYAVFGSLRYRPVKDLVLETGLRATQNSRYDAPLIPSLHVKYNLTKDLSLRASYGKGFRSPSLKELFLSFIDINHFIIGNPDLEAETSDNYQVNLIYQKSIRQQRINARLHLFHNRIKNQIQLFPFIEQDGQIVATDPGQSTQFAYFNLEQSTIKGANLRLGYQWKGIELEAGVSSIGFFNPLSDEMEGVESFTYTTEINGRIGYQLPFSKTKLNLFTRFNDRFISYFPATEDNETIARQQIQDGFTMMDASLSQPLFNNRIQFTAGVRNLLDITQVNVSGGNTGVHVSGNTLPVGAGRSFFVRASIRLFDDKAAKFRNRTFEAQQKLGFRLHDKNEQLYASWIEDQNEGEQVFQFAAKKGSEWERPKTIKIGNKQWFINDIDAPQFSTFKNNDRNLLALWLEKANTRNVYDHHIWLSHSKNKGKTWSAPYMPYDSEIPAFYGLAQLIPLSSEKVLLVWMDGRDTKELFKDTDRYVPKKDGQLSIRSVEINTKGKLENELIFADKVSGLCPFDGLETENGAMFAYRTDQNDIVVKTYKGNSWSTIASFQNSKKKLRTISAPVIDKKGDQIALFWFTEQQDTTVLNLTISRDNGRIFNEPISIPSNPTKGKLDVLWLSNEKLAVCWDEPGKVVVSILGISGAILSQKIINYPNQKLLASPKLNLEENGLLSIYLNDQRIEVEGVDSD